MKNVESESHDEDMEDSQSLTASDFDVLNKENFFDRINDAFTHSTSQNLSQSKASKDQK